MQNIPSKQLIGTLLYLNKSENKHQGSWLTKQLVGGPLS